MAGICLPIDAVAGSPQFPAAQHRVAQAALMAASSGRPLGARSGVRPGAEPVATLPTSTTYAVSPFTAIVDPLTSLAVGPYLVAFLASQTGSVAAADQTLTRIDDLSVQVPDDPTAGTRDAVLVYTAGTPGGTRPSPAGGRFLSIASITVPKVGAGSPTVTHDKLYTVASGGVRPVASGVRPSTPYVGQYLDDAALGLIRWNGSAWIRYAPAVSAPFATTQGGGSTSDAAGSVTLIPGTLIDSNYYTLTGSPATTFVVQTSGMWALTLTIRGIAAGDVPLTGAIVTPARNGWDGRVYAPRFVDWNSTSFATAAWTGYLAAGETFAFYRSNKDTVARGVAWSYTAACVAPTA